MTEPRPRQLARLPVLGVLLLLGQAALACHSTAPGPLGSAGAGTMSGAGSGGGAPLMDPGRKDMHRLNTAEYNATVQDVLGTPLQLANGSWRGGEVAGFDNIASVLGMDEAQYERYFKAAKTLAQEVFASDELRARFVSCELSEPACVTTSIEAAGLRLFRRPLAAEELATYRRVYDAALTLGDSPVAALSLVFEALLSSAEFLYRIEIDAQPQSVEAHPLSSFELASRLSYFLWSSAPDEALLLDAAGSLTEPSTLAATVERLLDDPKSQRFVMQFAGQWLGARQVAAHAVIPELSDWNLHVARAAGDEMFLYFSEFLRSERSWFEFPLADVNYVEQALAYFYGMPTPEAMGPVRLEYKDDRRFGFFGLAGFLALSSPDRRTSPSLRGRWILSNLLCAEPPAPPPNVPKLEDGGVDPTTFNVRQNLERHRESPECAACHALFDPYGLALEEYDAIGRYRSEYPDGTPVDAFAVLPGSEAHPEGVELIGLEGLARVVAADPRFGECLGEKLFTYGLGRLVSASDAPYLQRAQQEWLGSGHNPSIRRLIQALVLTEPFRFRRGEDPGSVQP